MMEKAISMTQLSISRKDFYTVLFADCEGKIELRAIKNGEVKREFFQKNGFAAIDNFCEKYHDYDLYHGVASRDGQGGKKENCINIYAVWCDIDFKDISEEKANELLKYFPLEPSIVIRSGGGYHVYWFLSEPLGKESFEEIEKINKRLAQYFTGDRGSTDITHVLRVPETLNHKPERANPHAPTVKIEKFKPDVYYELDDLGQYLPKLEKPLSNTLTTGVSLASLPISFNIKKIIQEGEKKPNRSEAIFKVLRECAKAKINDDTVVSIFENYAIGEKFYEKNSTRKEWLLRQYNKVKSESRQGKTAIFMTGEKLSTEFKGEVTWLWRQHIPAGMPSLIGGREGDGKTTCCLQICKELLETYSKGFIVWLAVEGFVEDTFIKIREMGLDKINRFGIAKKPTGEYRFDLRNFRDVELIENLLDELTTNDRVLMVVVDSLRSATAGWDEKIKPHIDTLNAMVCDRFKSSCLWIHHMKKGEAHNLLDKFIGDTGITASMRAVFAILKKSGFVRTITQAKYNVAESPELEMIKAQEDVIIRETQSNNSDESKIKKAETFLIEIFKENNYKKILAAKIYEWAEEEGINGETLKKAKKGLGIESQKDAGEKVSPWYWVWR